MMEKWVKTLHEKLDQMMEMIKALQEFKSALEEMRAALARLEAQQGEVLQAARGMPMPGDELTAKGITHDGQRLEFKRAPGGVKVAGAVTDRPAGRGK